MLHTTDKAQATASLEAVALAIKEVVLRQMIESANTVVLADTTIIPTLDVDDDTRKRHTGDTQTHKTHKTLHSASWAATHPARVSVRHCATQSHAPLDIPLEYRSGLERAPDTQRAPKKMWGVGR